MFLNVKLPSLFPPSPPPLTKPYPNLISNHYRSCYLEYIRLFVHRGLQNSTLVETTAISSRRAASQVLGAHSGKRVIEGDSAVGMRGVTISMVIGALPVRRQPRHSYT